MQHDSPALLPIRKWIATIYIWSWIALGFLPTGTLAKESGGPTYSKQLIKQGIQVDVSMRLASETKDTRTEFMEGDRAVFRFAISEAEGGKPVSALYPAAWLGQRTGVGGNNLGIDARACEQKIAGYINGNILQSPQLDLNSYRVLVMNDDATLTVVDPLFTLGGTSLLALIELPAPGYDWALTEDQNRLFVSTPGDSSLAVIDTNSWKVAKSIKEIPSASCVRLQPDEQYLWCSFDNGVVVIDANSLERVATIETGKGPHDISFREDSRFAFVSNAGSGSVCAIDTRSLKKSKDLDVSDHPQGLAYSSAAVALYVVDGEEGIITCINAETLETEAQIKLAPGLSDLKFCHDGRFGIVVNSKKNSVHVIEAATRSVIQTAGTAAEPFQIGISEGLVYILHRGSDAVFTIPLRLLGKENEALSLAEFSGGRQPVGKIKNPSGASMLTQAASDGAVVFANPSDQSVYYYQEGMAAAKGSFSNYKREARAVTIVNRAIREIDTGIYETSGRLGPPGEYDLAFLLDAPRIVHCFPFSIKPNPEIERTKNRQLADLQPLFSREDSIITGAEAVCRFKATHPVENTAMEITTDLIFIVYCSATNWTTRVRAVHEKDGTYAIRFTPKDSGFYSLTAISPSLNITPKSRVHAWIRAIPKKES